MQRSTNVADGSIASLRPCATHFRSSTFNGHRESAPTGPVGATGEIRPNARVDGTTNIGIVQLTKKPLKEPQSLRSRVFVNPKSKLIVVVVVVMVPAIVMMMMMMMVVVATNNDDLRHLHIGPRAC